MGSDRKVRSRDLVACIPRTPLRRRENVHFCTSVKAILSCRWGRQGLKISDLEKNVCTSGAPEMTRHDKCPNLTIAVLQDVLRAATA